MSLCSTTTSEAQGGHRRRRPRVVSNARSSTPTLTSAASLRRPELAQSSVRLQHQVNEWRLLTFGGRSLDLCETARLRYAMRLRLTSETSLRQTSFTLIARDRFTT